MSPATRHRLLAVGALLLASAGLAFIAFGNIGENLVYYWSPSEMLAQGEKAFGPTIRLGGIVAKGSVEWNDTHTSLRFKVADNAKEGAASVTVDCTQTPPQMFREGIGVVVEGTFDPSQVFKTSRLMVNHSNEYRPPSDGGSPDWQKSLGEVSASTPEKP